MEPSIFVAVIAALASVVTAALGSIATAKLRREERRSAEAEVERQSRDEVIEHYRGLVADLASEITRLRASSQGAQGRKSPGAE